MKPVAHTFPSSRHWVHLAVAVILGLFLFQVAAQVLSSRLVMGVLLGATPKGPVIRSVLAHSPAARAGLPIGGRIVELDGTSIGDVSTLTRVLRRLDGRPTYIVVEQHDQRLRFPLDPGAPPDYYLLILNFLVMMLYLGAALLALRAQRVDPRLRLFALFCLVVALDVATEGHYLYFWEETFPQLLGEQILAAVQFVLVFHLFSLIPEPAPWIRGRWMLLLYLGMPLLVTLLYLIRFGLWAVPSPAAMAIQRLFDYNLLYLSWGLAVLWVLIRQYRRHASPLARGQLRQLMAGVLPWLLFQAASPVLMQYPVYPRFWFPVLDAATHLFFGLALMLAIFRYNLLDLNEFVSRRTILRLLPPAVVVFAGTVVVAALLRLPEAPVPPGRAWLIALAGLLAGLGRAPLQEWLDRQWLNRLAPQGRNTGRALRALSRRLTQVDDRAALEQLLEQALPQALNCHWARLQLAPAPDPLHSPRTRQAAHIFPLRNQGRPLGALLIGPQREGRDAPPRERELLALFAETLSARLAGLELQLRMDHDPLTGLLSRDNILARVKGAAQRYLRERTAFSISMLDLDDFKHINDEWGHLAGDQALQRVGEQIRRLTPTGASVGRFGGEEFLMLMPGADKALHCRQLDRLRRAIGQVQLPAGEPDRPIVLSISIGLANVTECHDRSDRTAALVRELIGLADERLYQAKSQGKNRCVG